VVKKTKRLGIVTEACGRGSVASDISARVVEKAFDWLDAPIRIVAGLNIPIPYNATLEYVCTPHKENIVDTVKELFF